MVPNSPNRLLTTLVTRNSPMHKSILVRLILLINTASSESTCAIVYNKCKTFKFSWEFESCSSSSFSSPSSSVPLSSAAFRLFCGKELLCRGRGVWSRGRGHSLLTRAVVAVTRTAAMAPKRTTWVIRWIWGYLCGGFLEEVCYCEAHRGRLRGALR
jgi:hypothetical protein